MSVRELPAVGPLIPSSTPSWKPTATHRASSVIRRIAWNQGGDADAFITKDYLPLCLIEFSWRFNNRKNPNAFADLIQGVGR